MAHQSRIQKILGWLRAHWQQLFQFGIGYAIFELYNHIFDFTGFPASIAFLGYFWGAIAVSLLALLSNALVYYAYDHMKIDWLQAQTVQSLAEEENQNAWKKFLSWQLKDKKTAKDKLLGAVAFASLTLALDPVMIAVYYRESLFGGISKRDWWMLVKATGTACVMWLLVWEPGVFIAKWTLHFLHLLVTRSLH